MISSSEIADEGSLVGWLEFHPSYVPGDPIPYNPDFVYNLIIEADYNLATMPPPEILNFLGNPFIPSVELEIPINGNVYAVVSYANTGMSELWLDYPSASLLLADVGSSQWETVNLGSKSAGDKIRFNIRSANIIVAGSNLYPKDQREETYMPDGDILMWRLNFEDWTDLRFENIELEVYVTPDSGLDFSPVAVIPEPDGITPGDTAQIVIKRRYLDGTLEDFDSTQTFEIGMLDGCALGMIKIGTDSGAYVYGATQPILFIVDANADTGIVKLRVGLIEETGGSSRSVRNNIYEENIENDKAIKNKVRKIAFEKMMKEKQGNQTTTSPENTESCWGGIASTTIHKKIDIPIIKLIIIYPTPYINEAISREPRMPEVICKAKLSSFYPGKIKYEWKYIVRKYYDRRYVKHSPICTRVSRSEFQGLSYSNFGLEVTEWKVPFEVDSGYFYFKSLQPRKNQYDPLNHIYGCSGESNEWYDSNEEIFTGGDVLITITAKEFHTGKILAKLDTVYSGKIRGLNPDINSIHSYANSNKIKAIMWQEGKTNHFTGEGLEPFYWWPYNEEGWPLYGSPNGYGLMQLDNTPAPVEEQLWNWKSNIDGGRSRFNRSKNETQEYINNNNATYVDSVFYMNAYQNYNSGIRRYWDWNKRKEIWEESEHKGINPEYGRNVYNILKRLNQ